MTSIARDIWSVLKLRIGLAITATALAGVAVTPGPSLPSWKAALLALAVLLSSASAGAFNQYVERESDGRMRRTKNRPFVTGRFCAGPAWLAAIVFLLVAAVGATAIAVNLASAAYVFLGAFTYGVVYTVWLKRRTSLNIVIGGLAGSFAVLAGAAAVDPALAPAPIILALVLFLWTPPHFWSLALAVHEEYAAADVPMLPVVIGDAKAARVILAHAVALVPFSLLPVFFGLGWAYTACAALGGAYFIKKSSDLVRCPGPKAAWQNFHASLVQLSLLLLGTLLHATLGL